MSDAHAYLSPRLTPDTLDNALIRRLIVEALKAEVGHMHGTVLDIGCGVMPYKPLILAPPSRAVTYIGLDLPDNGYAQPDLTWDGKTIPMDTQSVEIALATEVLEHCPDPLALLIEARRVLKPRGRLFVTTPFLWPLHCVPFDEYRYTPFALKRLLQEAGFIDVQVCALGGWDASLAQFIGLWVRRRPMAGWKRQWLAWLLLPLIKQLAKRDRPPEQFHESSMVLSLSATAIAP